MIGEIFKIRNIENYFSTNVPRILCLYLYNVKSLCVVRSNPTSKLRECLYSIFIRDFS